MMRRDVKRWDQDPRMVMFLGLFTASKQGDILAAVTRTERTDLADVASRLASYQAYDDSVKASSGFGQGSGMDGMDGDAGMGGLGGFGG
jgi:hypothetical protein